MPTFTEFCIMVLQKTFKIAHAKNSKKIDSGAVIPTSNDELAKVRLMMLNNITLPEFC